MRGRATRAVALAVLFAATAAGYVATADAPTGGATSLSSGVSTTAGGRSAPGGLSRPGDADVPGMPPVGGDASALLAEFDAGLRARPEDPSPLRTLAEEMLAGHPQAALSSFRRLVAAYPEDAETRVGFGEALLAAGEVKAASRAVRQALSIDPGSAEAKLLRGKLLAGANPPQIALAVRDWTEAIELADGTRTAEEAKRLVALYEGR